MNADVIINKDALANMTKKASINGYTMFMNQTLMTSSAGQTYLAGYLMSKGEIPYKIWDSILAEKIARESWEGKICEITGYKDEYNGKVYVVITGIEEYLGTDMTKADFYVTKYDGNQLYDTLTLIANCNLSESAMKIFNALMDKYGNRFKEEFAAISHHDNCVHGLLSHTLNVTRIATMVKNYPSLRDKIGMDELILGAIIHDVGKILEYNVGAISEEGKYLSHMTLGLRILEDLSCLIINLKGPEFYWTLMSIVQQHGCEYGERPRTLAAYVVGLCDTMEAKLSDLNSLCESSKTPQIIYDNYKLSIQKPTESDTYDESTQSDVNLS